MGEMIGNFINELFQTVVGLSLVGSYVILLVLIVRLTLRRAPRWCSYLLWGIVFLRLVCPNFPVTEFSLIPSQMETLQGQASLEQPLQGQVIQNQPIQNQPIQDPVWPQEQLTQNQISQNQSLQQAGQHNFPGCLWLVIVLIIGGYHILSYWRLKGKVKAAVEAEPGVREIRGEHLSFVMGIFKPVIYLSEGLDEESRKVILCHERVHLQRKDYLWKPAALAICCVHWFNPLVWLAFYLMNKDCEMSCDEKVVSLLGEESKKVYSYALLDEATKGESRSYRKGSVCALLSFGEDNVKNRIRHVLHYKKASLWIIVCAVILLVILTIGLCCNPADESRRAERASDRAMEIVAEKSGFAKSEIASCYYSDFDDDGKHESFVIIGAKEDDGYVTGELWFVSRDEDAERLLENVIFVVKETKMSYDISSDMETALYVRYMEGNTLLTAVFDVIDGSPRQIASELADTTPSPAPKGDERVVYTEFTVNGKRITEDMDDIAAYQICSDGVYRIDEQGATCMYAAYIPENAPGNWDGMACFYDGKIYMAEDSDYKQGVADWSNDSICVLDTVTGEAVYLPLTEDMQRCFPLDYFYVTNGFIVLSHENGSSFNEFMLEDTELVWEGKKAVDLSEAEKQAFGVANRNYILEHPNYLIMIGNHTPDRTFALIDLDGDGITEEISMEPYFGEPFRMNIMDNYILRCEETFEERYGTDLSNEIWAFSPDGKRIFLALYEDGPSGDPFTIIFKYVNGRLQEAGDFGNDIRSAPMENGIIYTSMRSDVIQTDAIRVQYQMNAEDVLEQIQQETYEFTTGNDIELKKTITVHTKPGGGDAFEMPPQTIRMLEVDSTMRWVLFEAEDGQRGWFDSELTTYENVGDYFDGLYFYG